MDLLERIRAARQAEAHALLLYPGSTDVTGLGTGIGMEGLIAAATIEENIASMIQDASDLDLLHAYQRTDRERGNPEVDLLLTEIGQRGLNA